jgi:iron complex outermembrane receptor protein
MFRQFSIGLVVAGALIAACPAPAAAADAQSEQPGTLEALVITGTRIRAPNLASESPVTAVSDEEIKNEGATNIENVLNELPQFHVGQSNTTSNNSTVSPI